MVLHLLNWSFHKALLCNYEFIIQLSFTIKTKFWYLSNKKNDIVLQLKKYYRAIGNHEWKEKEGKNIHISKSTGSGGTENKFLGFSQQREIGFWYLLSEFWQ